MTRSFLLVEGTDVTQEIQVTHDIETDGWTLCAGNGCEDGSVDLTRQTVIGLRDGLTQLLDDT